MPLDLQLTDSTTAAIAALQGGAEHYVAALAHAIEQQAKDLIHPAYTDSSGVHHASYAHDTGALKASISAVTFLGSDFDDNIAAAGELRPEATFADEVQLSGPMEAAVQAPINYAGFVEMGTSLAPAQPFLTPAAESVAAQAESIAKEVFGL